MSIFDDIYIYIYIYTIDKYLIWLELSIAKHEDTMFIPIMLMVGRLKNFPVSTSFTRKTTTLSIR